MGKDSLPSVGNFPRNILVSDGFRKADSSEHCAKSTGKKIIKGIELYPREKTQFLKCTTLFTLLSFVSGTQCVFFKHVPYQSRPLRKRLAFLN